MRLIDADALKRKAQKLSTEAWKANRVAKVATILNQFIDWIEGMPTIDVVEVVKQENNTPKGEWSEDCKCTICGFGDEDFGLSQIIRCNFCPNCGAKMI